MKRIVLLITALAVALVLGAAGCGGGGDDGGGGAADGPLVVSAAASLQDAFAAYGDEFGDVKLSFAGSDTLAAQIRQGVTPDVFASANMTLPEALAQEGLVDTPTVFAGNRLVLAVPADSDTVTSLEDLAEPGVKIAIGSESVPIGSYTRKVLDALPEAERTAILANVRSEEPDVKGIVGKLTQGAVDAGFVYVTDVAATRGELRAIEMPDAVSPPVAYGVAVVEGAENPEGARRFIDGLLSGAGQRQLEAAGFEPPPE
jgi:molybdate transport system substrate-binding protein